MDATEVPQKIKLFLWKACQGILPTTHNLFRRKVSITVTSSFCDEGFESTEHILYDCDFALEVRGLSSLAMVNHWPRENSFADFVQYALQTLSSPDIELLFTLAWKLWMARNDRLWDYHLATPGDICSQAGCLVTEYLALNQKDSVSIAPESRKWQPPHAAMCESRISTGEFAHFGALAILHALWFTKDLGLSRIIVEGDNKDL